MALVQAPDRVAVRFGKPQVTVGTSGDTFRTTVRCRHSILSNLYRAAQRHAADLVGSRLGEPEIAIMVSYNPRETALGNVQRELRDMPAQIDPANLIASLLGEPEGIIEARRDAPWPTARRRDRVFVGDLSSCRDPANLIGE